MAEQLAQPHLAGLRDAQIMRRGGSFAALAILRHAMQKRFDARLGARVPGVAVGFNDRKRLARHHMRVEVEVETVRSAGIVATIEAVLAVGSPDLVAGAQDPLAVSPIHGIKRRCFRVHPIAIQRNPDGPLFAQDRGDVGVQHVLDDRIVELHTGAERPPQPVRLTHEFHYLDRFRAEVDADEAGRRRRGA